MKVLFVSSGNSSEGISPIIVNQAASLTKEGIDVAIYTIKGKGVFGYISNIIPLKNQLKNNSYDIVHAHYSLSAMVASLEQLPSKNRPIISPNLQTDGIQSNRNPILKLFMRKVSWILSPQTNFK